MQMANRDHMMAVLEKLQEISTKPPKNVPQWIFPAAERAWSRRQSRLQYQDLARLRKSG